MCFQVVLLVRGGLPRKILMENVIPSLTKALVEVAKVRPEDPVDYVAEYLFKNNPDSVDTGAVSR